MARQTNDLQVTIDVTLTYCLDLVPSDGFHTFLYFLQCQIRYLSQFQRPKGPLMQLVFSTKPKRCLAHLSLTPENATSELLPSGL